MQNQPNIDYIKKNKKIKKNGITVDFDDLKKKKDKKKNRQLLRK